MRASGQQPAARRADTSASKQSSKSKATPRRAAGPVPKPASALLKRAGRTTASLAAAAAMVGGLAVATAQPASAAVNPPSLHLGMRGTAVVRLQKELTAAGRGVPATGYFGTLTRYKVNRLKRAHGWRQDGYAGPRVWYVLLHDAHPVYSPSLSGATATSSSTATTRGQRALAYAKAQLGKPYVYGADGPYSFDCSGLTMEAWRAAGISLPHNTVLQYNAIRHVSRSSLRPGDLVFFYSGLSHVAIYAGNGRVIHAPRPGQTVQYILMKYMPFAGAGRPG
jgi:cell wall-associated NlpC family hydrolase